MMDNAQEFYVYNPVKPNKGIGRRTGKPVYKKRNINNGVDNFDDYFTDSDDEASINVTKHLQVSVAEGTESSQALVGVLSSEKSDAALNRDLSFREDVASKSIQQLPPEKFDSVRIFNPLNLGSRFGRRTGKDVLAGKVLTGGMDNFSAFLSDNTDISISMQATPTQATPEQLSPSTSVKKSGGILSSKKSKDRTQVLVNIDSHLRTRVEKPSFSTASSGQQCSEEGLEPACDEEGISHSQVPEHIIAAVEVEHMELVLEDASSNDAKNKRLQEIDRGSTNVNSLQKLMFENSSSRASLNATKVKNSFRDDGQAWVCLSMSEEHQAWPEKDSLNTSKVKTCHNDDEQAQQGLSMSKAAETWSEKENLMPESDKQVGRLDKTEEVQATCEDSNNLGQKEAADIYQHISAEEEEHTPAEEEEEHTPAEEEEYTPEEEEEHTPAEEEEHTPAEESTKTVSGVQKVGPVQQSQPSVVNQVQHLESSKGHQTQPAVSLLVQSTGVQAQQSAGLSRGTESLIASQSSSSGQKNPSIAAASFCIPSVSNIDQQSHTEKPLQSTDLTGRQGTSKHMTKSSAALNFGGDISGSVSRSEQAVSGQFFGIKKRLSYSYALTEVEQPSVQGMQNVETARLAKAVPREKKTIVSFLDHHDRVSTDYQFTASETGTFVTLAPRRISQLTSDEELLKALNTSTDAPDDFCIVEEESIVCDLTAVTNKHQNVKNKSDKKQNHKRNSNNSSAKQEKTDVRKQQTDVRTDSQEGNNLQANQDSLLEENQVTNLPKKRKSVKSAGTVLDDPDTSLEARTLISLTSQQVTAGTDHRGKKVQGDKKFNKRKVKHSIEDEASPPKQIKSKEEQDTDAEVQEENIDSEVFHSTELLNLQPTKVSKIKHNKKEGSLGKQVMKQLKENNKVLNTTGKRRNLPDKVGGRNRKKVGKNPNVPDKPNSVEKSFHASPEENNVAGYLNTQQNNPPEINNKESKTVVSKVGKSSKQNKGRGLSRELKQLQDTELPKLKRSQRNRNKVLSSESNSDNSSSDLLQQESVTVQNPTADAVTEVNSPAVKNSQQYRFRTRHTAKSRQHHSDTQSEQHPSVTQSEQHSSVTQSEQHSSVTQSEQHPSVTESEQYREPIVSETAIVAKITKQKLKVGRRNKTSIRKQNQTSGRSKASGIQKNRKLSRLSTNFNLDAIYENITEEEINVSDSSFHNTSHTIVEVNVSKNNLNVDEGVPVDVPRSQREKNVKNTTLEKTCTENYIDSQEISYVQGCDMNHKDNFSTEKNADSRKSADVSVPMELQENKKKVASGKSVCGRVRRRAGKSLSGNTSVHSQSGHEVCSPPKLQLISSLPNVTPQSGISFRRSWCHTSDVSGAGSFSPPAVPRVPTRDDACFTPRLKEQKTPVISSCLKNADSSVRPRRKGRRVRISSIIDQKMYSPVESEISDSQSVATTSLLSVNSSPVHYAETTTNNITRTSKDTGVTLPDLSYKIIRPEASVEGLRRSTRTRVMRLNTDRGEDIIYRRDSTGFGLIVDGIQPSIGEARVKAIEERRRKMLKQRKLKAMTVPAKPAKRLSTHWKVDDMISSSTEIPVINPDNNEEVLLELVAHADSATWYGPDLTPVTGTEPVALCLHLKQHMFTTGEMNMRGLAEKPCELTIHTLIMYVICGKILLRINGVSTIVDTGGNFFIPRGTSYSIKNLRRDIAKLYFVDIDDTDRDHSFPKSYSMSVASDHME